MPFDKFDESYLMAPLLKNGTVWSVAIVERKGEKIYFSYSTDKDAKEFFSSLIFKKEKAVYRAEKLPADIAARTECTTRIYHLCFENLDGSQDCYPKPVTKCIQKNDYLETESDGGTGDGGLPYGGGTGYQGTPTDSTKTPCAKMKAQNTDARFKEKVSELDHDSIFKKKEETGYAAAYGPQTNYEKLNNITNDKLKMPIGNKYFGYMHAHLDKEGVVKIFSSADVFTFLLKCVRNAQEKGTMSDAYAMVITSQGTYTLKYSGTTGYTLAGQSDKWKTAYNELYNELKENELADPTIVEKVFTQFLKEVVNINGVEVYKTDKTTGNLSKLTYNGKDNPVQSTPCP